MSETLQNSKGKEMFEEELLSRLDRIDANKVNIIINEDEFVIPYGIKYKMVVKQPDDALSKMYDEKNEMIVNLRVPTNEYNDEDLQELIKWSTLSNLDEGYFRNLAIYMRMNEKFERTVVYTHAYIRMNKKVNTKADYVDIELIVNQRGDKFVGVGFGHSLEDALKKTKERVASPPRVSVVVPVVTRSKSVEGANAYIGIGEGVSVVTDDYCKLQYDFNIGDYKEVKTLDIEKIFVTIKVAGESITKIGFNYEGSTILTSSNLFAIASLIGKTERLQNIASTHSMTMPGYYEDKDYFVLTKFLGVTSSEIHYDSSSIPHILTFINLQDINEELKLMVKTIYGEAAGSSEAAWEAIANVIINRIGIREWRNYTSVSEIIKFTGFDAHTYPNNPYKTAEDYFNNRDGSNTRIERMIQIIYNVYYGISNDITNGAVLYYSPNAQAELHRSNPSLYTSATPNWNFSALIEVNVPGTENDDLKFYKYR